MKTYVEGLEDARAVLLREYDGYATGEVEVNRHDGTVAMLALTKLEAQIVDLIVINKQ